MHTCVFLRGIQWVDPHSDAIDRNELAPFDLIQYVSGNVLAPSDLVLLLVMFLTVYLSTHTCTVTHRTPAHWLAYARHNPSVSCLPPAQATHFSVWFFQFDLYEVGLGHRNGKQEATAKRKLPIELTVTWGKVFLMRLNIFL